MEQVAFTSKDKVRIALHGPSREFLKDCIDPLVEDHYPFLVPLSLNMWDKETYEVYNMTVEEEGKHCRLDLVGTGNVEPEPLQEALDSLVDYTREELIKKPAHAVMWFKVC